MQKTSRLHRLLAVIVAVFMAVCCLPLNAFAKEGVEEQGTVTVNYVYGDKIVGTELYLGVVNEFDLITFSTSDLKEVPDGYEIANTGDLSGPVGANIEVAVNAIKDVTEYGTVTVNYVYGGESVGTENYTGVINEYDLICFNTSELKNVPNGYEIAAAGDKSGKNGDTINVEVNVIKEVTEYGTVTVNYVYSGESVGTENYTGVINEYDLICFNTSDLKNVPNGYEIASKGDLMGANGATIDVNVNVVKDVPEYSTITINYVCNGECVGTEQYLGVVNEYGLICFNTSELKAVPAGYELASAGDMSGAKGATIDVQVNEVSTSNLVIVKIQFKDGDEVVAGGDYFVPAGVQNYSVLKDYVPEGYVLEVSGDFLAADGAKLTVAIKKITNEVIMKIQFKDGDEVVAGGDYFVPAGVQNYSVLGKYVPAGYSMDVSGDFMAQDGGKLEVPVSKIENAVIMNIRFIDSTTDEFVAGGDYFLPEGVQNYKVLTQYLPEGYKMDVSGDFTVAEGASLDVPVSKLPAQIIMNIRFIDSTTDEFVAGGDYFLSEGVHNYTVLADLGYLPEGYEMDVAGDFMAKDGGKLDVPVHKIKDESGVSGSVSDSSSSNNNATTGTNNQNGENKAQVVKSDAPAANTAKVLPQTGLTAETPVVFGVMMFAALAGAGAYLFAIRKKLN